MQQSKAEDAGRQAGPGVLDNAQPVVAHPQTPQPLQPADGPLHHPADLPQPAAMLALAPPDVWLDAQPGQDPAGVVAVEAPTRRTPRRATPSAGPAGRRPWGSPAPAG